MLVVLNNEVIVILSGILKKRTKTEDKLWMISKNLKPDLYNKRSSNQVEVIGESPRIGSIYEEAQAKDIVFSIFQIFIKEIVCARKYCGETFGLVGQRYSRVRLLKKSIRD